MDGLIGTIHVVGETEEIFAEASANHLCRVEEAVERCVVDEVAIAEEFVLE